MKKSKIWLVSSLLLIILLTSVFLGHKYISAKGMYELGVKNLNQYHWNESKQYFQKAKQKGTFFFQDGENLYEKKVNAYGKDRLKIAEEAFNNQQFEDINKLLHSIPADAKLQNEIKELEKINPLNVKIQNYLSPQLEIKKTTHLLFTSEIPGIVVEATQGQGLEKVAYIYIIIYDPSSSSYKVAYNDTSGYYNDVETKVGKLFNDSRNGVVVDLKSIGGSGWSTNTVILSYDQTVSALKKNLDLNNYKSTTEIKNNYLIVLTPDGETQYSWNGEQFEGKQIFLQPSVSLNDRVIHYSISEQEEVLINPDNITLKIGERLILIRDDQNKISERILFSIGPINSTEEENEFIANESGETTITIIPNEYNWEKSKEISITVLK